MAFTTLRESVDDHADSPSAPTKSGVRLGAPKVRSVGGIMSARSSHTMRSALYAHMPSAPLAPPPLAPAAAALGRPWPVLQRL
eukprot:3832422-Pleurochrysis_carterae.AAC.1